MDYYTVLTIGFVLGHVIPDYYNVSVNEVCFYAIMFPSFFDLCSIVGHIFKLRGIKTSPAKFLSKILVSFVKDKNCGIGNVLEEEINEEFKDNKNEES